MPDAEGTIPAENQEALERAHARATLAKVDLLKRADMLTGAQLAERLGLTRATVDKRRTEGKLLALDFGTKRGFRYPAWQGGLVQDAEARATFEQVLRSLGEEGVWSRYRFFTQATPALGGVSPTEALCAGRRMRPALCPTAPLHQQGRTWPREDRRPSLPAFSWKVHRPESSRQRQGAVGMPRGQSTHLLAT